MTEEADLVMPRTLAIRILHEAQIAQPDAIWGEVGARNGEPCSFTGSPSGNAFWVDPATAAQPGHTLWARLWSNPAAPAVPTADQLGPGLYLVVSLNTKGVLEMRAWQLRANQPYERVLKVRD